MKFGLQKWLTDSTKYIYTPIWRFHCIIESQSLFLSEEIWNKKLQWRRHCSQVKFQFHRLSILVFPNVLICKFGFWLTEKSDVVEEKQSFERLSSYQYVERAGSIIPTASLAGTEVSVDEIRSATASSDRYYPPSLHAPLISSPEPDPNGNPIQ